MEYLLKRIRFLRHRIRLWFLYHVARCQEEDINIISSQVFTALLKHGQAVNKVGWFLFLAPGYNREISPICWETPVAIIIWINDQPAFGIGLELWRNRINIRQLHGVAGTSIPGEFKPWPKICVKAILCAAEIIGAKTVRLYRAHADLFYQDPFIEQIPSGKSREEIVADIRRRMRRRYDGTARQLGFNMLPDWGEVQL